MILVLATATAHMMRSVDLIPLAARAMLDKMSPIKEPMQQDLTHPFVTNTTTTGFTFDTSVVGSANYQIGVDYTNNAVTGFANPNTGGTQALSLDNTYYTISSGSDEYLTSQFNAAGSIAEIQTLTATVIANTQGVDGTYSIIDTID